MYLVTISIRRGLTPEEGQKELQKLWDGSSRPSAGIGRINNPGDRVTPYADWIFKLLMRRFSYDHVNFMFVKSCRSEQQAIRYMNWVVRVKEFFASAAGGRPRGLWSLVKLGFPMDAIRLKFMRYEPTMAVDAAKVEVLILPEVSMDQICDGPPLS